MRFISFLIFPVMIGLLSVPGLAGAAPEIGGDNPDEVGILLTPKEVEDIEEITTPTPESRPSAAETSPKSSKVEATVASPAIPTPLTIGASTTVVGEKFLTPGSSDLQATYGGIVEIGYRLHPNFGVNLYGGARYASGTKQTYFSGGFDLEILPFEHSRLQIDQLEFAFLIGASNLAADPNAPGSFHAGTRLNFLLNPNLGLTLSARGNPGYAMLQSGLIIRL